jgi:general secretion pathway protein G
VTPIDGVPTHSPAWKTRSSSRLRCDRCLAAGGRSARRLCALALALLIVVSLLAACAKREEGPPKSDLLLARLEEMRSAIARFHSSQHRYPHTLAELTEKHYLKAVPVDPITGQRDWKFTTEETVRTNDFSTSTEGNEVVITDVHSAAPRFSEY